MGGGALVPGLGPVADGVAGAAARSQAALDAAAGLDHPFSLVLAKAFASWSRQFEGDVAGTLRAADETLAIARERRFAFWFGWGRVMRGWAVARVRRPGRRGDRDPRRAGRVDRHRGLSWAAVTSWPSWPTCWGRAGGRRGARRPGRGRRAVGGDRRGLLAAGDPPPPRRPPPADGRGAGAEAAYRTALDEARRQQARSHELRASPAWPGWRVSRGDWRPAATSWPRSWPGSPRASTPPTRRPTRELLDQLR